MRSSFRLAGVAVALTGAVAAFACGDDHQFNGASTSSDAGAAGAETSSSSSGDGGSAGSVSTNQGGDPAGSTSSPGGATSSVGGNDNGAAGAGGEAPAPSCVDGFSDWLTSSFSFPDGDVIGTSDFPSRPWLKTGDLKIDTGRVTGAGLAVVNQGAAFPYAGARLRFKVRFTDQNQEVTAAFDAAADGSQGIRVQVDGYGRLSLFEDKVRVAYDDLGPLETGVDWFVEATFEAASGVVSLASKNYASEKQAVVAATVETDALKATATGSKLALQLASNGISPSVDELSFARCGLEAPAYEAKLVDDFERANSATLGKAQIPVGVAWISADPEIKIVDGALQTAGNLKAASIPLELPLSALRIRSTVKTVAGGNSPYLWADVDFNVKQGSVGGDQGFWMWGGPNDTAFYTGLFNGGGDLKHNGTASADQKYFLQMDRDDNVAVLIVRQQSFEGPIVGMQYSAALVAVDAAVAGKFLALSDEGGQGTRFEDIRADVYPAPVK